MRKAWTARSDAGVTMAEVLVSMVIVMVAVAMAAGALVSGQRATATTERTDESVAATQAIMAKARQVSYSDLGFYRSDAGAPSGVVTLPISDVAPASTATSPTKEQAVVLGTTRPAGTSPFTTAAVDTFTTKNVDYKVTTWVTAVPAIAPDTVSRAKRVTVRTEWAPTGAPLTGLCTGASRCSVQSMVRTAAGSDVDPTSGNSAQSSAACQSTRASVCESYVRSGRVLDGARMATGNDIPFQSEAVELYARTSKVATSVTASWTYTVATAQGTAVRNVTKTLTSDDGGTRWTATIDPDPVVENAVPKGDIRPGSVTVRYTAKIDGANVAASTPAFWSYTLATGADSDHITAAVGAAPAGWCAPVSPAPIRVAVSGHSVGLRTGTVPTSSADTVSVVFTVPDAAGARTLSVDATLVAATPVFTNINGIDLASSTNAVWQVATPPTSDCSVTANAQVVVHRAADQTDTVVPVRIGAP